MRVFPHEISIWISRLSKVDCTPQCGYASSNLLMAWIDHKVRGRRNSNLLPTWLIEEKHWYSSVLGLGFTPSAPMVLQLSDSTSWDSLASRIMWLNSSYYIYWNEKCKCIWCLKFALLYHWRWIFLCLLSNCIFSFINFFLSFCSFIYWTLHFNECIKWKLIKKFCKIKFCYFFLNVDVIKLRNE